MKKVLKRMMAVVLVLALVAPVVVKTDSDAAAKGFYFKNAGVSITMGSKAAKFIKAAGKPKSTKVTKSCAYKGLDRVRKYKNFILYTYSNSKNGAEYVNGITFTASSAKTKEGIKIGSTEAAMKKAYGEATPIMNVCTYTKGKSVLNIQVKNGKVTNLQYVLK